MRSPTGSPCWRAMNAAAARAASRRGSSMMIRPSLSHGACSSAGGTRVVLPAPGGATRTRFGAAASAASTSASTSSTGKCTSIRRPRSMPCASAAATETSASPCRGGRRHPVCAPKLVCGFGLHRRRARAGAEANTMAKSNGRLSGQVRQHLRPLATDADLDPLLERIGDARVVLLGEASHGTSEYYTWRDRLSRRLIAEQGFDFIAVEGDWPDCYTVNLYADRKSVV